jgi:hypothetical protein
MKETVLVEFLVNITERDRLIEAIDELSDDEFDLLNTETEFDTDGDNGGVWYRVSGKIDSGYASVIKLGDPFLSERMRISYISDDLKDKYRK